MTAIVQSSKSRVAKASKDIPPYTGTIVNRSFLRCRLRSWQQHLKRVSPFLVSGEGVWWESVDGGYLFRDSDNDVDSHSEGPKLLHYRHATIKDVTKRQTESWKTMLTERIQLPTPKVFLYTSEGNPKGEITYPINTRQDGHEGTSDGQTKSSHGHKQIGGQREACDMESAEVNHEEDGQTSYVDREGSDEENGRMSNESEEEDIQQTSYVESGEVHVRDESEEENDKENGQTRYGESGQSHSGRANNDECEAQSDEDSEESRNGKSTQVKASPETPPQDIKINLNLNDDNEENMDTHLKTKHAACVSKVLGVTDKVLKFDELRYQLKLGKKPTITQKQEHNKLLAELQSLIQAEKSKIVEQIKQLEAAHFETHATIPTDAACPERIKLMKQYKFVNKLLATWNIQL